MTEPLTPAQTAAAVKQGIGDFGFTWMADKAGRERGKGGEHGPASDPPGG